MAWDKDGDTLAIIQDKNGNLHFEQSYIHLQFEIHVEIPVESDAGHAMLFVVACENMGTYIYSSLLAGSLWSFLEKSENFFKVTSIHFHLFCSYLFSKYFITLSHFCYSYCTFLCQCFVIIFHCPNTCIFIILSEQRKIYWFEKLQRIHKYYPPLYTIIYCMIQLIIILCSHTVQLLTRKSTIINCKSLQNCCFDTSQTLHIKQF